MHKYHHCYRAAQRSALARQDVDYITSHLDCDRTILFKAKDTDTQALMTIEGDDVFLAFRGTERKWRDILTDLLFIRIPNRGIFSHAGFTIALNDIWGDIEKELVKHKGKKITFTGHSLGGALAALAAHRYKPTYLITFGQPRVAGEELGAYFEGIEYYRFVNKGDIVPHLPFGFGYRHHGTMEFWDKNGKLIINPGIREIIKRAVFNLARIFKDHSIYEYIYRLRDMLSEHGIEGRSPA